MGLWGKTKRYGPIVDQLREEVTPAGQLVLDPPEDDLAAALAAAAAGEAAPVQSYLATLRLSQSWDLRSRGLDRIAAMALDSPLWVKRWAQAQPEDPDAQLTLASLLVKLAWEARTNAQAEYVEGWRFREFHEQLEAAAPQLQLAAELNPADPEPWRLSMQQATGLEAPYETFHRYLTNAREADPWHYPSCEQAVNRLSAKWGGSHEAAFDFAEYIAGGAPDDRVVHILPMRAAFEMWVQEPEAKPRFAARSTVAMQHAQSFADRFPPGAREAAEARNMLGYLYAKSDRFQEAFDALHATRHNVSRMPWAYELVDGKDYLEQFATLREAVVIKLAQVLAGAKR